MKETAIDFSCALLHMRRAIRRGDLDKAERWQKLAERSVAMQQRFADLAMKNAKTRGIYNPA